MKYLMNILLGLDFFLNSILGGHPDEWISTRAHRLQNKSKVWSITRRTIDFIAEKIFNQKQHCFWSYVSDQMFRAVPPEKR